MEKTGTVFTCDECGKQVVDASSAPETPEGWITPQTYTSYDRLYLMVGDGLAALFFIGILIAGQQPPEIGFPLGIACAVGFYRTARRIHA